MIGRLSVAAVAIAGAIYGSERLTDRHPSGERAGLRVDPRDEVYDERSDYEGEVRDGPKGRLEDAVERVPRAVERMRAREREADLDRAGGSDFNPQLAEALTEGGIFDDDGYADYADIPHGDRGDGYAGLRPEDRPSAEHDDLYDQGYEDGLRRSGYRRGLGRDRTYLDGYRAGRQERDQRFAGARPTAPAVPTIRRPRAVVAGAPGYAPRPGYAAAPAVAPRPAYAAAAGPGAPPPAGLQACTGEAERRWGLPQGGAAVANARAGADGGQVVAIRASGRRALCVVDAGGRVQSLNEDG